MRASKHSVIIAVALILAACATTENYKKILNTWIGSHVDRLVSSWGPPQGSFKLSNGGAVLEYRRGRTFQVGSQSGTVYGGGGYGTYSGTSTSFNINKWCNTRFTVGSNGIIETWSMEGNECISRPPD